MKNSRKTSQKRKPKGNARLAISRRSRWSYFMQGMYPDDGDKTTIDKLTKAFGPHHPAWLIATHPGETITAERFKLLREHVLMMSREQVAAYLRVSTYSVAGWERCKSPVPFAAYEALRLLAESIRFKLSHPAWDGWFINSKTGELVSPDIGKLAVLPQEINSLPQLYGERDRHRFESERLREELAEAIAENTRLRTLYLVDGVTDELRAMQERLDSLLGKIGTAAVLQFQTAKEQRAPLQVAAS